MLYLIQMLCSLCSICEIDAATVIIDIDAQNQIIPVACIYYLTYTADILTDHGNSKIRHEDSLNIQDRSSKISGLLSHFEKSTDASVVTIDTIRWKLSRSLYQIKEQ